MSRIICDSNATNLICFKRRYKYSTQEVLKSVHYHPLKLLSLREILLSQSNGKLFYFGVLIKFRDGSFKIGKRKSKENQGFQEEDKFSEHFLKIFPQKTSFIPLVYFQFHEILLFCVNNFNQNFLVYCSFKFSTITYLICIVNFHYKYFWKHFLIRFLQKRWRFTFYIYFLRVNIFFISPNVVKI